MTPNNKNHEPSPADQSEKSEDVVDGVIIGAILQSKPGTSADLASLIEEMDGVDLYAIDEQERIVITVEAQTTHAATEKLYHLEKTEGVLYVNAVHHYCESDSINNEGGWTWR